MSTSYMTSSGSADAAGKNWIFTGSSIDPMSGEPMGFDERMTVIDNDHHVFEMSGPGPDGVTFKMIEITYTRKK